MPTIRVWNGSQWNDKDDKSDFLRWNGTTWVEPTDVRVWDGAVWQSVFGGGGEEPTEGITLRATSSAATPSVNSLDVSIPGSTQEGDLLVLAVAQTSNAATLFNAISGWTKRGEQRAGTAAFTMAIYTRVAQSGDAGGTVTSTSVNAQHYSGQLRAYSGVNQSTPLDATTVFSELNEISTSASAPAITVATSGALLVTVYGVPTMAETSLAAGDWTDPSGFSNELVTCPASGSLNRPCIALYDRASPGTGSQGPYAATITQSRRWAVATMALRPAS